MAEYITLAEALEQMDLLEQRASVYRECVRYLSTRYLETDLGPAPQTIQYKAPVTGSPSVVEQYSIEDVMAELLAQASQIQESIDSWKGASIEVQSGSIEESNEGEEIGDEREGEWDAEVGVDDE